MQTAPTLSITKLRDQLTMTFASTLENIDLADEETRQFLTERGLETAIFAVCLSMREGMTNAVKHGHGSDAAKSVCYSLLVRENHLMVEIEDEGPGFDWRAAQEKQPAVDCDHGRGLAIIRRYSHNFWYNEKGNKLFFTIAVSPAHVLP